MTNTTATTRITFFLDKAKVGESVEGYVKGFFKNPNSQFTPDADNVNLLTKDGEEVTVWAKGNITYLKRDMEKDGTPVGTYCRITKIDRPESSKSTRQKYFAKIEFRRSDVKSVEELEQLAPKGSFKKAMGDEF